MRREQWLPSILFSLDSCTLGETESWLLLSKSLGLQSASTRGQCPQLCACTEWCLDRPTWELFLYFKFLRCRFAEGSLKFLKKQQIFCAFSLANHLKLSEPTTTTNSASLLGRRNSHSAPLHSRFRWEISTLVSLKWISLPCLWSHYSLPSTVMLCH